MWFAEKLNLSWQLLSREKYANENIIRNIISNSAFRSSRIPWILHSESLTIIVVSVKIKNTIVKSNVEPLRAESIRAV